MKIKPKNNKPKLITRANFRRFGWIIEYPDRKAVKTKNLFKIIVRQPGPGWRVAYLVVRDRVLSRLEQHPDSLESFEPLKGEGLLFLTTRKNPGAIECFALNKPVILKKGVWHGVVTLSKEFDVKIVENARVRCVYWPLGCDL